MALTNRASSNLKDQLPECSFKGFEPLRRGGLAELAFELAFELASTRAPSATGLGPGVTFC